MLVSLLLSIVLVLKKSGAADIICESVRQFLVLNSKIISITIFVMVLAATAALWNRSRDIRAKENRERKQRLDTRKNITLPGFVEDSKPIIITGWDGYIKALGDRLAKTKLNGESFALGVAGDWGSGKTTFLNTLHLELENTFKVIDFNPWACSNANVVISDFFKTLQCNMPRSDKDLIRDIGKYVRLLTEADIVSKNIALLTESFKSSYSESITSVKKEIEQNLSKADTRYAVLIDDLDRLQQDELFEILRLIRITASFSNILFVVTYDRHHIIDMLNVSGISEGAQYVKKIFNTEVILPGAEPNTLPMMLVSEIEKQMNRGSKIPALLSGTILQQDDFETYELLHYLKNFRDVKRFAMAFAANVSTIESNQPEEFSYPDFFWLEILRYIDYDMYSNLRVCPSNYLKLSNSILSVKENISANEDSLRVLNKLFPSISNCQQNSISYMHNFHNYFSFRILNDKLTQAEFNKLLNNPDMHKLKKEVDSVIMQGKLQSLIELFNNKPYKDINIEQKKNYISLMFAIVPNSKIGFIDIVRNKLNRTEFDSSDIQVLSSHATNLLHDLVQNYDLRHRGYINLMLSRLHSKCRYDSTDDYSVTFDYKSIIEDATLKEESENNLCVILSAKQNPIDITQVTAEGSPLRKFIENATILSQTDYSYGIPEQLYTCLPFQALYEYYVQHKSDKLDQFMQPFAFKEDELPYAEDEEFFSQRLTRIIKVFGNLINFAEFTYKCFTNPEEDKDRWIVDYWKIRKPQIVQCQDSDGFEEVK